MVCQYGGCRPDWTHRVVVLGSSRPMTSHCQQDCQQDCQEGLPETAAYIDTQEALERLCAQLALRTFVALDTEFVRERTYLPQLCLLQVAAPGVLAVVDPLVLSDVSPLWEIVKSRAITKVLHAGRQDLEIFYEHHQIVIDPLFDTQLAATLLGYGEQVGYGALVEAACGVTLEKAYTRTDWTSRPLHPGQLRYAADDVRYLVPLYQQMQQKLEQDGQQSRMTEECANLAEVAMCGTLPVNAWKRVRGFQTLEGKPLVLLQHLAAWREQQARAENRPRRWIVADDVLLKLARHPPQSFEHLQRIGGIEMGALRRYGHEWIALLHPASED